MVFWDCLSKRGEFCRFTGTVRLVEFSRVSGVSKVRVGIRVRVVVLVIGWG